MLGEAIIIGKISKYSIAALCSVFVFFLCAFPKEMLVSAREGLLLWYNSVLPSILPFLIVSNILIEIGAVSRLGVLLEPVMKPVFNVSGSGAFALIMGGISGYPVGAKITADLREKGVLVKDEAQRLISFCNNSGPLFVLGAVGTAILGSVAAGYYIMVVNYISAAIVGVIFRLYKSDEIPKSRINSIYAYSRQTPLTIGSAISDSVSRSIEIILQIGGFILIFGALIKVLQLSNILSVLSIPLKPAFSAFNVDESLAVPFICGLFEVTNGIKMLGETDAALCQKIVISGVLVSFGGMSIFAQTASFISKTDISPALYLFAKLLQAVVQAALMIALYPVFERLVNI